MKDQVTTLVEISLQECGKNGSLMLKYHEIQIMKITAELSAWYKIYFTHFLWTSVTSFSINSLLESLKLIKPSKFKEQTSTDRMDFDYN